MPGELHSPADAGDARRLVRVGVRHLEAGQAALSAGEFQRPHLEHHGVHTHAAESGLLCLQRRSGALHHRVLGVHDFRDGPVRLQQSLVLVHDSVDRGHL